MDELREIIHILCDPDEGCPWDSAQTHASLKDCLVNETNEVLEAIDREDRENLREELGDVLLQVIMHSEIAEREGWFTLDDVVQTVSEKMIRRHPHVFGDMEVPEDADWHDLWEQIKAGEKDRDGR